MSSDDWNPIGTVIGSVLGGAIAGPILGPLAPVIGGIIGGNTGGHGDAPQAPPPHPPTPTPGGSQLPPPPPAPGPLPPPPQGPAPGSGQAADQGNVDANTVADVITQLHELDKSAAATIDAIHAAGTAGQQQLDNIGKDVNDKITELGPRLDTPTGQQELRDFLKEKLTAAKKVLDQQIADAEAKARQTRELTEKYGGIGGDDSGKGGTEPAGTSTGGGGGDSGGGGSAADQGTAPAAAPAAAAPAAGTSPLGQGMMPGAGMMPAGMGMPQMPSFGGGMPGMGGDPLSALSGLGGGQGGARDAGFRDDQGAGNEPKSDSPESKFHDETSSGGDQPKSGAEGAQQTSPAAADTPAAAGAAGDAAGNHTPTDPAAAEPPASTHIALPDGGSAEARTVQGANAVKAALGGAPVADAWHQAGVNVPPPGTPVINPIPPTKLQAGDVGVWQDHLVMALGNGKVLVSGQVQPLTSVGSSPDFLGWMDPSAQSGKPAQPAPAATPVPPTPSVTPPTPPSSS